MTRRTFLRNLIQLTRHTAVAGLFARPFKAGASMPADPEELAYIPLNGKSLKEIALQKLHHGDGRFLNPFSSHHDAGRFGSVLYWKILAENHFDHLYEKEERVPVSIDWRPVKKHDGLSITFLKHAGLMIKDRGRHIYVDPIFFDLMWFIEDFTPIVSGLDDMPAADHVLITHGHYDHLDIPSLSSLSKGTHVISPLGYDDIFDDLGMKSRSALDWFGAYEERNLRITLLPCNHWTMRNPLVGPNRSLWGSFLIETSGGQTIYISGDTSYFDGFQQLGKQYDIDLAIFNLGAYEPRWFMAPSHMNPAETIRAAKELKARRLMVVHWGTFRLGDEPVYYPPEHLQRETDQEGITDRLVLLNHGKTLFWDQMNL